ncbi:MAG: UDP-N-acetylmuramoyl-tripeptide--D-alanyl-D-alanine ligase [Saprospiraceae bacterium]
MLSTEALYAIFQKHPVVCTDTRALAEGSIFFALKGPNFNGNTYAEQALKLGAAYAVIDEPNYQIDERCLLVPDVLEALQQLATTHRRSFDIPLIAIGGSNGKTTTKELVSAVLSSKYPCHFTQGNLNNQIGVPLTLLRMPANTEVAVIEMGVNKLGDMAELCAIAEPTHGLLTNIGKEHLAGFGNIKGVIEAEGELYQYLDAHKGWIFANYSDKLIRNMSSAHDRRIIFEASETLVPQDHKIDIQLLDSSPFVHCAFLDDEDAPVEVESKLIGNHNFQNIMTAIALGMYFKVPAQRIKSAIESYRPSNNRSQLVQRGEQTILLDAYNANPSSMLAVLSTFEQYPSEKKIAILGDMLELGASSLTEHQSILNAAIATHPDELVLVGPEFAQCTSSYAQARFFNTTGEAQEWFNQLADEPTFILIKGSRGIRLEKLLEG